LAYGRAGISPVAASIRHFPEFWRKSSRQQSPVFALERENAHSAPEASMNESEIFSQAIKLPPEERRNFVATACDGNRPLLDEVEALLHEHFEIGSFISQPAVLASPAAVSHPISEGPGTKIGPYKLLEQIGEGGFGVVFMAEQTEPVRRKVALKILKPGMDTRQVIARFEAERQALALMDHPSIARVLDAGAAKSGRPFFVMELVKGIPITDYCDQYR